MERRPTREPNPYPDAKPTDFILGSSTPGDWHPNSPEVIAIVSVMLASRGDPHRVIIHNCGCQPSRMSENDFIYMEHVIHERLYAMRRERRKYEAAQNISRNDSYE